MSEAENGYALSKGWTTATLGDLIGYDGVFCDGDWVESKDQDPAGDIRLIQLADVGDGKYRDRSSRFLTSAKASELRCTFLQSGDLLVARMPDPLGRVCSFPGDSKPCVTVVDVCILRVTDKVSSRWLMHQLNTPQIRRLVSELQSGTTRKRISRVNLAKIAFPVPPFSEQEIIARTVDELLSDLDAGVAALERAQAKLKHYRAAVLKAAVEGELTAEWRDQHPGTEPASELLTRILAERRRRWEEAQLQKFKDAGKEPPKDWKAKYKEPVAPVTTNLPKLPERWCWSSLGECFAVHVGATPSRVVKAFWNGDIPWVASGEVQFCHIFDTREKITAEGFSNSSTQLNPAGSVILNMIGEGKTRGKAGILKIAACNNQNCAAVWVSDTPIPSEFIYFWLLFRYEQTRQLGSGNNQPAMNKSIVEQITFPLPPLAEQEAIVDAVEDQISIIDHLESDLEAKLKSAQGLRQSILRHAFTGQLVPQDPSDEPASELLTRIAVERQERAKQAVKDRKLSKPKSSRKRAAANP
ncbi:MAG: type I restriction endonuclease subunit S [Deltaproteobacteria bacterium]|nr:type I restriction endonuclease subunit S [Deltaproteobacteria bacterium]